MKPGLPPLALAYHGVGLVRRREDPASLFVSPRRVARHIGLLRSWGYQLVTFGQLAERVAGASANACCALTFDDGLAAMIENLVPILVREGVSATVFAVPRWVGAYHPDAPWARTLDAGELRVMADAGVEIGSHSLCHRDLSLLSYAEAKEDLRRSRAELEEIVERPVDVAAYPFGRATADTATACRDAGYRAAAMTSGNGSWDDPWALPRQNMHNYSTSVSLWLKRRDRYEPLMANQVTRTMLRVIRRTTRDVF